jgi:hypothetical protein
MSTAVFASSDAEERIRNQVRRAVLQQIERRGLTDDQFAMCLGMLPSGALMLRQRPVWSLSEALWAAEKLGVRVKVEVAPGESGQD